MLVLMGLLGGAGPVAAETHGGLGSESAEGNPAPAIAVEPATQVLLENGGPAASHPAPGASEQVPAAGGPPTQPDESPLPGFPVFIVADGPNQPGDTGPSPAVPTSDALIALIRQKVPQARIVHTPFSALELENAWLANRKQLLQSGGILDSATVILNARAELSPQGDYRVIARGEKMPEKRLALALSRLQRTLVPDTARGLGLPVKVQLILLTGDAGAVSCPDFPGPIFGMAPLGAARDGAALDAFIQYHRDRYRALFPIGARDWYDSWEASGAGKTTGFFFCPIPNARGYLGNKRPLAPFNAGIE